MKGESPLRLRCQEELHGRGGALKGRLRLEQRLAKDCSSTRGNSMQKAVIRTVTERVVIGQCPWLKGSVFIEQPWKAKLYSLRKSKERIEMIRWGSRIKCCWSWTRETEHGMSRTPSSLSTPWVSAASLLSFSFFFSFLLSLVGFFKNWFYREREIAIDLLPPICVLTRDQTLNLYMSPDQELNQ